MSTHPFNISIIPSELSFFSEKLSNLHRTLSDRRVLLSGMNSKAIEIRDAELKRAFEDDWPQVREFVHNWVSRCEEKSSYELWVLESLIELMDGPKSEAPPIHSSKEILLQFANEGNLSQLLYFVDFAIDCRLQGEQDIERYIDDLNSESKVQISLIGQKMKQSGHSGVVFEYIRRHPLQESELARYMYFLLGAMDAIGISFD